MNDPRLNNLFRWGVENSEAARNDPASSTKPRTQLDPEALKQVLFPQASAGSRPRSDPEWMAHLMDVVGKEQSADEKAKALEHFEELIANLDNANGITFAQWTTLVAELQNEHRDVRLWAAWCCDTAVQNNVKTQERVSYPLGAIPVLSKMATGDADKEVRKKAIKALSSAVTNFQPSLDATLEHMPTEFKPSGKLDACDMDHVQSLIGKLRDSNK
ncbi:Hsp70 nucleotide exchange factor FES1 [Clohesyomyces aquaticus]|uniref:Hsp70 nucleotide exchange factor FES1 n=1 Tax=Clohesyomyces aquaticus TaxID=1231657 RepID=A0A1Y1ZK10_9PLEO|nr:Hsp70 nucleotide exchange factor FES1 [Clohesyomyces aquaticus]